MRAHEIYHRLVRTDAGADETAARNGLRHVGSDALQGIGDQVVNAKTVLPWLLSALGAPGILLGLLVPIREAGSMLPQAGLSPWVLRRSVRKWIWVAGALGQATSVAAMAVLALTSTGWVAGIGIVVALTAFATARALNSLSGKDVLGRTVPKGQRGQITGLVTVVSGALAVTLGVALRVYGGDDAGVLVLVALLAVAAAAWLAAAAVFATIEEPPAEPETEGEGPGWARRALAVLREDPALRRFVTVRALLLVSALSPPFVVAIAAAEGDGDLAGLGPFVIAQGLASLLGGRLFGRLADRSSRRLMIVGSAVASVTVVAFLGLLAVPSVSGWSLLHPLTYLVLAFVHTGVRVARKTYVVDMAADDRRTEYVAVSNTAIGILLLVAGVVSGALATFGNDVALWFLAALGALGVVVGRGLPEVSLGAGRPVSGGRPAGA